MEQSQLLRNDDEFAFRVLRDIIIPSLEEHPKMHPVVMVKKEKERKLSRAVDNCGSRQRGWRLVLVQRAFFRRGRGIVGAVSEGKVQRPFLSSDGEKDGCPFRGRALQSCRKRNEKGPRMADSGGWRKMETP